jgi:geranylgeranyl diphosphate synthase type I
MNFADVLNKYQCKVNRILDQAFNAELERARERGEIYVEYYRNLSEFTLREGKRLRPVSLIMAYKGVGGRDEASILWASSAIEFLHNSTLIHDDIMDRDKVRRKGPTFHIIYEKWFEQKFRGKGAVNFGKSLAILGGDNLFELGLSILAKANFAPGLRLKAIAIYGNVYKSICEGQILDKLMENRPEVTEAEYLDMISMKTGSLFEGSLLMGCTLGNGSKRQNEIFRKYSIPMAQAFQIQDDVLGTFGREEETGKSTESDIRQGKRTLIIIKALKISNVQDRRMLLKILGNEKASHDDIEHVREIICKTGALDYAKERAVVLAKAAAEELSRGKNVFTAETTTFFIDLAKFVLSRKL